MKFPLLLSLVLCESLLPATNAVAAAKRPNRAANVCLGGQVRGTGSHPSGCVAVARQVSHQSSGTPTRRSRPLASPDTNPKERPRADPVDEVVKSAPSTKTASVQTHRVERGETLSRIAARFDTTESSLMALNGFTSDDSVRQGQILFVPSQDKVPTARSASAHNSWRRYAKPPKEKGSIDVSTPTSRFVGPVLAKEGQLRPAAVRALNDMLGAGGKHPPLPERLIRLLVKVSDAFGGRPIRLVSGYRTNSYYQDSRHRQSAAVDFMIVDVPNPVLCEYLRDLEDVGVGYYPNSTFVHLDVRNQSTYWVDYAGPGEPPRSSPNAPRAPRGSKRWLLAELDALVNHTTKSLARPEPEPPRDEPEPSAPTPESLPADRDQPRVHDDATPATPDSSELVSL